MKKNAALFLMLILACANAHAATSCNSEIRDEAVKKAEAEKGGRCTAGSITFSGNGVSEQLREEGSVYVSCIVNVSPLSTVRSVFSYDFSMLPEGDDCSLIFN
jgi:hypothetical protein